MCLTDTLHLHKATTPNRKRPLPQSQAEAQPAGLVIDVNQYLRDDDESANAMFQIMAPSSGGFGEVQASTFDLQLRIMNVEFQQGQKIKVHVVLSPAMLVDHWRGYLTCTDHSEDDVLHAVRSVELRRNESNTGPNRQVLVSDMSAIITPRASDPHTADGVLFFSRSTWNKMTADQQAKVYVHVVALNKDGCVLGMAVYQR